MVTYLHLFKVFMDFHAEVSMDKGCLSLASTGLDLVCVLGLCASWD